MSEPRKPTEKDALFFLTIICSMKNSPDVDWNLVSEKCGYMNAMSARARFSKLKKTFGFSEPSATANERPGPAQNTTSPAKKSNKGKEVAIVEDGFTEPSVTANKRPGPAQVTTSPAKKSKKGKGKEVAIVEGGNDNHDDDAL
ncbi:hypothetical protein ACMFMG_002625 [Clarireedia jacksonii]